MPDRITHKCSTILISTGAKLRSFRSLNDVPEQMRRRLESTAIPSGLRKPVSVSSMPPVGDTR